MFLQRPTQFVVFSICMTVAAISSMAQDDPIRRSVLLDKIPARVIEDMLPTDRFVGHSDLSWNARVLTVAFENGPKHVHELIEVTAEKWTSVGELELSFRESDGEFRTWTADDDIASADIRIGFRGGNDGGYWSAIGALADNVSADSPTMNLEGLDEELLSFRDPTSKKWLQSYAHATILHEFGHAFGLAHEHFHRDCQRDLDIDAAVSQLMRAPNNWTEQQARFNLDYEVYVKILFDNEAVENPVSSAEIDGNSVMLYALDAGHMISGKESPCQVLSTTGYAFELSTGDREYYLDNYASIKEAF